MLGTPARDILFAALCFALSQELAGQQKPHSDSSALVIAHVTVIDATGAPAGFDKSVAIIGDRIVGIGESGRLRIPKTARVVDGKGKFLIPGLWDMHVHLDYKDYLPLFLANGVTGVRVMLGSPEHHKWLTEIESGSLSGPRMKMQAL